MLVSVVPLTECFVSLVSPSALGERVELLVLHVHVIHVGIARIVADL